ncbi:hypothetical protein B5C34_14235 [Pacificimonas flava]|uniref:Lipoprotein n=2 Tax=Pacificimonas TaxID=1960290 RepID=A0A219B8B0_9SPHN|nr:MULTISPECIES: hypothetical protein [Pacificimonas]MBZ6379983.1 hypothetical protein [Pacificimonas aurantium]OWV34501.1 hypothetical protein B5C34_14235 [Pacificimonas flava]
MFSLKTAGAVAAGFLAAPALACSCMVPGPMEPANATDVLSEYRIVEGRVAQNIKAPDCEQGPDGRTYQTYVVTGADGESFQVRQEAMEMNGRCQVRSSAACGTTLPPVGRYFLKPLSDGTYRYPLSCDLVEAEAAYRALQEKGSGHDGHEGHERPSQVQGGEQEGIEDPCLTGPRG